MDNLQPTDFVVTTPDDVFTMLNIILGREARKGGDYSGEKFLDDIFEFLLENHLISDYAVATAFLYDKFYDFMYENFIEELL